ncbi:MAG: hypothetical protein ACREAZ_10670, partial [Nitrososphaera sp.]
TILNNEKARTGYEIQSLQENRDKETENYDISERSINIATNLMTVRISNEGPIPMIASQILLYCETCPPSSAPVNLRGLGTDVDADGDGDGMTLNAGETSDQTISGTVSNPITADNRYRSDVISERGNIVSSLTCTLQADNTCIEDSGGGPPPPCVECGAEKVIAQQTGSLQLEFKSFGVIYPKWGNMNGVDQTGWKVLSGNATGYPGSIVLRQDRVVMVERMRNLDPSQEDLTLTRQTGLAITLGKATSGQPTVVFICKDSGSSLTAYDETKLLEYTPPGTPAPVGFKNVFFCSKDKQAATNWWDISDETKFDPLNGIFMIARGWFGATSDTYSQTVPYQSLFIAGVANACLKTTDPGNTIACPAAGATANDLRYKYEESVSNMATGAQVDVRIESPRAGVTYSIDWVFPVTGKHESLAINQTPVTNNIRVTLPDDMDNGDPFTSDTYHTIVVTSSFYKKNPSDDQFVQDAFLITFHVT